MTSTTVLCQMYDLSRDEEHFLRLFDQYLETGLSPAEAKFEARVEAGRRCLDISDLLRRL